MAGTDALSQNFATGSNIANILTTLLGPGDKTTSGGTITKQTQVNPQDIMKQLLEASGSLGFGTGGLAQTLSQGKRAGVYGGRAIDLNLNDLLARIGTQAAVAAAPTVQTTSPTVTSQAGLLGGGGIGSLGMLLGANMLLSKDKRKQAKDLWDELLGTSAADTTSAAAAGGFSMAPGGTSAAEVITNMSFDPAYTAGGLNLTNASLAEMGPASSFTRSMAPGTSGITDIAMAEALTGGFGAVAGSLEAANAIGAVGGDALGSFIGSNAINWGVDASLVEAGGVMAGVGEVAAAAEAATALAGVGEVASVAATAAEGAGIWETILAIAAWIICTELHKQGRMSNRLYITGGPVFLAYPETPKRGYYLWAIPSVKHLRAKPNSWYSRFLCKVFNSRAQYLFDRKYATGKGTAAGFLITHGLYYACYAIGFFVPSSSSKTNWRVIYG